MEKEAEEIGEVLHMDLLCKKCGWFNDSQERPYGCDHPEQEETDDETKKGKCYPFSCPIANALYHNEPEDRKILGEDWKNLSDGDWLQVYSRFKNEKDKASEKLSKTNLK